jgi:hypothetical protein
MQNLLQSWRAQPEILLYRLGFFGLILPLIIPPLKAGAAATCGRASRSVWLGGRNRGTKDGRTQQSQPAVATAAPGTSAVGAVNGDLRKMVRPSLMVSITEMLLMALDSTLKRVQVQNHKISEISSGKRPLGFFLFDLAGGHGRDGAQGHIG